MLRALQCKSMNCSNMQKFAWDVWDFKLWSAAEACLGALAVFMHCGMIFSNRMARASRSFPAVAIADAHKATV